ncbi:prolyl oligopeptidase [Haloactinospora alba]|uniref:prolyl oligopeptidase n=1 Tax=Haloactinospora alba TaxID=405555 RepID=A0A543NKQ7_9ACTN|nr:prolyl oligopeptidase family serine peptidase [Haloactinospora alba]TQN32390.1 prolyl oligopeptidase [Haloactinospora alba]
MAEHCYPEAERSTTEEFLHGRRIPDPYRWLEEPDTARTKEWSAAQDALFAETADEWTGREWFHDQLRTFMDTGFVSAPEWRGPRYFLLRRAPGEEHGALVTSAPDEGDGDRNSTAERVLVAPERLDPSGTTTLDSWHPDGEGRLLAYTLSEGGDEEALLRVMDVATARDVDGPIDRCRATPVAWLPGGEAFYYVRRLPPQDVPDGEEQYHRRVYLHRVGTPTSEDVLIFGAGRDKTEFYGVSTSHDGRWLVLTCSRGTAARNDAWVADLHASSPRNPDFATVQEGVDAEVRPEFGCDGRLYLFTDRDAPRGRVCVTDPSAPGYGNWRTLVASDPEAVLTDVAVLVEGPTDTAQLLASWRRHAVGEITRHDLATGEREGRVELPGLGSVGALQHRPEGGCEAWFGYSDHTSPPSVYRYDARTGTASPWASVPTAADVPDIRTEHVSYTSRDGTRVRMLVLSPPDADGPRPAILYGYGGFGISLTPGYSATVLSWVRAGGVYAVANLRGGLEEGEEWHRAGMLDHKQNVFDDFAGAAEYLISHGRTTADRLAAMGGSNGGLLVGASITQRPDLFAAAVCSAPLLDMVRYEHFGLGQLWNVEYGSAEDPEELDWLLRYSPYHNVRAGVAYPAVLFAVFDNDSRVDPLHARKMCAALQHATSASPRRRPVLLRRESEVGHSSRSVSRSARLNADQLAFLARYTGLDTSGQR